MADDVKVKMSEFAQATQINNADDIIILQNGENKKVKSPVLESKIINRTVEELLKEGGVSLNLVNLKGVVSTYANLPTTNLQINDAYQVATDGLVYVWNGTAFQPDGEGFKIQPDVIGVVEEGNTQAVSGGEVFEKFEENKAEIKEIPVTDVENIILTGEKNGWYFISGMPVISPDPNYSITEYIPVLPNTEYEAYVEGGLITSALYVYNLEKTSSRRVLNSTDYPIELLQDRITFTTGPNEYFAATYTKRPGILNVSIYPNLVIREAVEIKKNIEIKGKVVTPEETVYSAREVVKAISRNDNYIYDITSENLYRGDIIPNAWFNPDGSGSILPIEINDLSEFIPVKKGLVTLSAKGFQYGLSNRIYGYATKEFANGIELGSGSGTTLEDIVIDIPDGVNYIVTYTRLIAFNGRNNSEFLTVIQDSNYKGINLGEQRIEFNNLIENSKPVQEIYEILENGLPEEDNLIFKDIPFYEIPDELDSDSEDAIVKKSWEYKDIINNVFEVLRAEHSDYISLIGNYTQTLDNTLPSQSIGLSITDGTKTQYPLYLYDFKPQKYEKTVLLFSCEHGNEQESTITLCRFLQILVSDTTSPQISYLRSKVRFIVCPVLNPYGYNYNTRLNAVGTDMNRNYDFNFESYENSNYGNFNGVKPPVMSNENKRLVDALQPYLDEIDFAFSYHTGFLNDFPYWINSPVDALNRDTVGKVMKFLCTKHNVPFNIMGYHTSVNYNAVSSHYFSKILKIPTSTVDYVCQYPAWGERWKSKAMTIFLEQAINLIIAQCYEDVNNNSLSTIDKYESKLYPTPVSEEFGHFQKLSQTMVDSIFTNKLPNFEKTILGTSNNGNEILKYTHQATEEEERKVIVLGGIFSKISEKRIYNHTTQSSQYVNYVDGGRHVVLLSDFAKEWNNSNDLFLNELKKTTTFIIIPIVNVDSFYSTSLIDIDTDFNTSNRNEVLLIRQLINDNSDADFIVFNEKIPTQKFVEFNFSKNYPYGWRNGNIELKKYIESLKQPYETGISNSNIMNYISRNSYGLEIINNGFTSNEYGSVNWSSKNMTELANIFGNVIKKI